MKIPSRAWGFVRAGLNNSFGVTVPNFGTGGTEDNPLLNDVDAGDEAAGVEFCPVFAAQPSSGTLTVRTDGSLSLVGAADGTYVIPYSLPTFTPGDSAVVDEGDTDVTVVVGAGGTTAVTADLSAAYAIRAAVTADLSASYSVLQAVTADLAGSYTVDSSLTAVTADLAGAYAVHQQVTADLSASYTIDSSATAVTADLSGSFAILGRLQIDLSGSYSILSDSAPQMSASPIGRRLSTTQRPAAFSTARRRPNLSTRTR